MNCVNHPEIPVSAYCQYCGKALCTECVRPVQGVIYCEPCLGARLSGASGYKGSAGVPGSNFPYPGNGPLPGPENGPNPALAGFLGLIPGVAAMYNGQFVKAFVHVLVFVVLVSLSHINGVGIFIPAWIFYQVFDGYQTAKARRDGLPLPDPFGLNELGNRMSGTQYSGASPWPPSSTPARTADPGGSGSGMNAPGMNAPGMNAPGVSAFTGQNVDPGVGPEAGQGIGGGADQGSGYAAQQGTPSYSGYTYTPVPPEPAPPQFVPRRSEPVGAIILIGLGLLFLFSTTGFLSGEFVSRGWPLILIGLGAWLVIKRVREVKK